MLQSAVAGYVLCNEYDIIVYGTLSFALRFTCKALHIVAYTCKISSAYPAREVVGSCARAARDKLILALNVKFIVIKFIYILI